jgi:hypothetical protein
MTPWAFAARLALVASVAAAAILVKEAVGHA